ncbi:sigma-54-dependent transcriptional regulator [Marinomonas fungiae]|uniref:DNA-binding transcriptional response regulator, NtrC family, contains REC, AAA-type ATPase, and a Fis-type DNA-binding domains n=1 Tax=Marinomonas fungiae TaxID=1137284 RepID=A0A0K6IJB2_9GAMM|nr:sigma-54 dependent transcriptional regulator [Marinomonas fungiae]CUB03184.1 DNA-binding transcriptional response regulator, NtrC family, contains REC, AAA-type ATPase, and a Fis-type DNA-binding domains [Marinomonas fungiae]
MSNLNVLIIDDEQNLVRSIKFSLNNPDIEISAAFTGREGISEFEASYPDVVLLDLGLPDMSGLDVLNHLKKISPNTPVIMISAHGDTRAAVQAVKNGAIDYITKPFDIDELELLIIRSSEQHRASKELAFLRSKESIDHEIIGDSANASQLRGMIAQVARSAAKTILITGPSGTGKSMVAKSIHGQRYDDAPFIEVNCAALPEHLIEAELFGAEKGAYTGATASREGLIALANGGSLFMDEIGEMPLNIQAKLLTFLEQRTYRPIGSGKEKKSDATIIAATNQNLIQKVSEGLFRQDLFYRLNVLPIEIPALSERKADIPTLIKHFSVLMAKNEACEPILFEPSVLKTLQDYHWPGNIRELKNLVERLTILYPGQLVKLSVLPAEITQMSVKPSDLETSYTQKVEDKEKELILTALQDSNGHKGMAADKLGISRHALKRRIQRLQLDV